MNGRIAKKRRKYLREEARRRFKQMLEGLSFLGRIKLGLRIIVKGG